MSSTSWPRRWSRWRLLLALPVVLAVGMPGVAVAAPPADPNVTTSPNPGDPPPPEPPPGSAEFCLHNTFGPVSTSAASVFPGVRLTVSWSVTTDPSCHPVITIEGPGFSRFASLAMEGSASVAAPTTLGQVTWTLRMTVPSNNVQVLATASTTVVARPQLPSTASPVLFYRSSNGGTVTGGVTDTGAYTGLDSFGVEAGWTHVASFGAGRLLFYRASDGAGMTAAVDRKTGEFTRLASITFAAGWTHIVPAGDGRLFFYRAGDGAAATGVVDNETGAFVTLQSFTIPSGWTHISPEGAGRLFFYRAGDGTAMTGTVDRTTGGFFSFAPISIAAGWTSIAPGGNGRMLFYRASDGLAVTGWVDSGTGSLASLHMVGGFTTGWTHIVPWGANGLLFYRAGDGKAVTGTIDGDGGAGGWQGVGGFDAGWTQVVSTYPVQTVDPAGAPPASARVVTAPALDPVSVAGTQVSLGWTDKSSNEDGFRVYSRPMAGGPLRLLTDVPSRHGDAQGDTYTFTDTITAGAKLCYEVAAYQRNGTISSYSRESCTATVALPTAPAPIALGDLSIHDTGVISGRENSSAVGTDGLGIIAYYVPSPTGEGKLRVAHCTNQACTAITTTDLDVDGDTGRWTSLRIGSDGLPLISYVHFRSVPPQSSAFVDDLKVAHCSNVACTSATVTTVDADATVQDRTSLTIGADGLGLISYLDMPRVNGVPARLKVAHCVNIACTAVTASTVGTINNNSTGISVAAITTAGTGLGVVAYAGGINDSLKVVACTNADCSSSITSTVDTKPANAVFHGGYASITTGRDGLPLIAYLGDDVSPNGELRIAHCLNVYCTQATVTVADAGDHVVSNTAITLGADGLGVVSYYDPGNKDLKVAHCADLACGAATTTTLDAFDDVGRDNSIAIGTDGLPLVSYLGPGPQTVNLHVVHCPTVDCTGVLVAPF